MSEVRENTIHSTERRQAATGERCGLHGVEVANRNEVVAAWNEHVLRVSTVVDNARFVAVRTDHLETVVALAAVGLSTSPGGIDKHTTEFRMLSHNLVAKNHR
jgi:hypothetical protein